MNRLHKIKAVQLHITTMKNDVSLAKCNEPIASWALLKNEELRNAREKDAGQKQLPVHQIIRCMYHLGEF